MAAEKKSRQVVRHNKEAAPTFYANNVEIRATQWDVRFTFGEILDVSEEQLDVKAVAYIYMSLQHAKAFANVVAKTIREHEETLGPIQTYSADDTPKNGKKVAAKGKK